MLPPTGLGLLLFTFVLLLQQITLLTGILISLVINKARSSVKPRVFTDDLVPGMILYVSDIPSDTGLWKNVFIHDARDPAKPRVILARAGRLVIDEPRKAVEFHLEHGVIH